MSTAEEVAARSTWRLLCPHFAGSERLSKAMNALRRWPHGLVGGAVAAVTLALYSVFPPSIRAVVIDEWAYLKAAKQLASLGAYRPDPTAIAPDLVPVAISAALGKIAGHELLWLRAASAVSFVAMGVIAYFLAIEVGTPKRFAIVCGIVSAANPIAMPLAVTGMSDLPAAAFLWAAIIFGIRYLRKLSLSAALWCSVASLAAASIRPIGIVPLAVLVGYSILAIGRNKRNWTGAVVGAVAVGIFLVGVSQYAEDTVSTVHYLYEASLAPARVWAKMIVLYPTQVGLYLSLVAAPLSAGVLVGNFRKMRIVIGAVVGGAIGGFAATVTSPGTLRFPYMSWGSVIAANGVGGGDRPFLPGGLLVAISSVVGASAGVLLVAVAMRTRKAKRSERLFSWQGLRAISSREAVTVSLYLAVVVLCLAVVNGVMGFAFEDARTGYDRYLIPLFGPALALIAHRLSSLKNEWTVWAVACVLVVALTTIGVQDWAAQRRTAWAELESLTLSGVPATKIDGGFEWSADHQPAEYAPAFDPKSYVPWYIREFAPYTDREYVLSGSVLDGYQVVKTIRWKSWFREGKLYLQVRLP
ncbi:MAG: hypothetical protein C4319_00550 [Acidimicrobiia bacterium]